MKNFHFLLLFIMGFLIMSGTTYAQEKDTEINVEESAEVFLEAYADEFQESFFEALKQKGIENYDKAINLLLECKGLDAQNRVIDHELAKAYALDKQYNLALDYGVTAITSAPENKWYLNTLVEILQKQNSNIGEFKERIPFKNEKLQENLAFIYFEKKNYERALMVVDKLGKTPRLSELKSKITSAIHRRDKRLNIVSKVAFANDTSNPVLDYKTRMEDLIKTDNYSALLKVSEEALEEYPSQPYFYYVQGYAFNKLGKPKKGIEFLETALDFLIDDTSLANKIYGGLGESYNLMNEPVKANKYLSKIKPGL